MHVIFRYNPRVTEFFCWELEAYGCVQLIRQFWDRDYHDEDGVIIMPKGEHLLHTLLADPAYLNLCAMRTVVGVTALEKGALRLSSLRVPPQGCSTLFTEGH